MNKKKKALWLKNYRKSIDLIIKKLKINYYVSYFALILSIYFLMKVNSWILEEPVRLGIIYFLSFVITILGINVISLFLIATDFEKFEGKKVIVLFGVFASIILQISLILSFIVKNFMITYLVLKIPKDDGFVDYNREEDNYAVYTKAKETIVEKGGTDCLKEREELENLAEKNYYPASYFLGNLYSNTIEDMNLDLAYYYTLVFLSNDNISKEERADALILLAKVVVCYTDEEMSGGNPIDEYGGLIVLMDCLYQAESLNHPDVKYYIDFIYENLDVDFKKIKEIVEEEKVVESMVVDFNQNRIKEKAYAFSKNRKNTADKTHHSYELDAI